MSHFVYLHTNTMTLVINDTIPISDCPTILYFWLFSHQTINAKAIEFSSLFLENQCESWWKMDFSWSPTWFMSTLDIFIDLPEQNRMIASFDHCGLWVIGTLTLDRALIGIIQTAWVLSNVWEKSRLDCEHLHITRVSHTLYSQEAPQHVARALALAVFTVNHRWSHSHFSYRCWQWTPDHLQRLFRCPVLLFASEPVFEHSCGSELKCPCAPKKRDHHQIPTRKRTSICRIGGAWDSWRQAEH